MYLFSILDINLVLKTSDGPSLGLHLNLPEFSYIPEIDVFVELDKAVDLNIAYSANTEAEVLSTVQLNTEFLVLGSDNRLLVETYSHYFEKIVQSLLSTSDNVVEVSACCNVAYFLVF